MLGKVPRKVRDRRGQMVVFIIHSVVPGVETAE